MTWLMLIGLLRLTLYFLPFYNPEAALRLQWWLRDIERWADEKIEQIKQDR